MSMGGKDNAGIIKALIAGIAANMLVAISKGVAYFFTGSSAMLAESIHSLADSSNQALLALGLKRSAKPATESHQFGYAMERYFWAFMVSILIFLLGGAFALYEGIHKLTDPTPIRNVAWSYGALTFGILVECYALRVAYHEFQEIRAKNPGPLFQVMRETKDPTIPTVLFEDAAAVTGLLVAMIGVTITYYTGNPAYDAIATIVIGVILVGVAWFLARESHSLLVGEAASENDQKLIRELVEGDEDVDRLLELLTLQRGPNSILIALKIDFDDAMRTKGVENAIQRIEDGIRSITPDATHVFIEASSFHAKPKL
ncbi:MAG: cation diffusion facilitator family transporter [Planctomycetota bacterium]|jgi:cation diffusion facilitator family transporter